MLLTKAISRAGTVFSGWEYGKSGQWSEDDPSISLAPATGASPLRETVTVSSRSPAVHAAQPTIFGEYGHTGIYSMGRHVYRKTLVGAGEERYLMIPHGGTVAWSIWSALWGGWPFAVAGRGTGEPWFPEAATSDRFGIYCWRYAGNGQWVQDPTLRIE